MRRDCRTDNGEAVAAKLRNLLRLRMSENYFTLTVMRIHG
jgi:hypothetical protein